MRIIAPTIRTNRRRSQQVLVRHLVRHPPSTKSQAPNIPTRHITGIEVDPDRHHDHLTKLPESVMCVANRATMRGIVVKGARREGLIAPQARINAATKGRTVRENPGGVEE